MKIIRYKTSSSNSLYKRIEEIDKTEKILKIELSLELCRKLKKYFTYAILSPNREDEERIFSKKEDAVESCKKLNEQGGKFEVFGILETKVIK